MSFFDPKWFRILPDHIKPSRNLIDELEVIRLEYSLDHKVFVAILLSQPWAVKKVQRYMYLQYKQMMPHLEEKEIWRSVILSRIDTKRKSLLSMPYDAGTRPLTMQQLDDITEGLSEKLETFNSFEDVVRYIVELDEQEGQFDYPPAISIITSGFDLKFYYGDHSITNKPIT